MGVGIWFGLFSSFSLNILLFTGPFSEFEHRYPELVAVDSRGQVTANVMDFCEYFSSMV